MVGLVGLWVGLVGVCGGALGAEPDRPFGRGDGDPATAFGPARLGLAGKTLSAGTRALTVRWQVGPEGLGPGRILHGTDRVRLDPPGELFVITLADGAVFPASALRPRGEPRLTRVAPQPAAARGAARGPARQAEWELQAADGRFTARWRVIVTDGANYVRQELDLVAGVEGMAVRDVAWLPGEWSRAYTAGTVEGSPLVVADAFFLGVEDPHARNGRPTQWESVGSWSPADLALGRFQRKTWDLPAAQLHPGTNEFLFLYERGPHRLDLRRTALVEDGREVAVDEHSGRTGVEHVDHRYRLALDRVRPGARYQLAAELGTDPQLVLPPGDPVVSFGHVSRLRAEGPMACRVSREAPLRRGEQVTVSFVVGAAPRGQMRRAFLHYLERERAHPYRTHLHYNSWYDTAWGLYTLNETNCLEAIHAFGRNLIQAHHGVLDALVFDDGWDEPQTLWGFHRGFPRGFAPLAEACRQYGTRLGVWLSPFGGYGESRDARLRAGSAQGYETNAAGFSLAGAKYYAAFAGACRTMVREYGVAHFKFDGIASGTYADGPGSDYVRDTEAMRRLMLELRQEAPDVYINLTTGSWPSPFWLRFADSVWRQGGDMGLAGKGVPQQQWLTYRDRETYRNIVGKGPLYPLNALMTQGVAYSRHGTAGDPTFTSAGFRDDVWAFFGGGTSLQELYLQPSRLTAEDWRVLADGARWARANADVLVDTHWVGGDPGRDEVYGYAAWAPRKGTLMLRNPDEQPRTFQLEVGKAFELPARAVAAYRFTVAGSTQPGSVPEFTARAGVPVRVELAPFQVRVWDAWPIPGRR